MKTQLRLLVVAVIAGGTMLAQGRVSVGIGIGVGGYDPGYYPAPVYDEYAPPCPGPGYTWIEGYWAPRRGGNSWIAGFWRPPMRGYRMAPRYVEPRYYNSYRDSDRGYERGYSRGYDNRRYDRGERFDDRRNHSNERRGRGYSNDYRR